MVITDQMSTLIFAYATKATTPFEASDETKNFKKKITEQSQHLNVLRLKMKGSRNFTLDRVFLFRLNHKKSQ